jgi:cobyrinic acid a,c-diamide synthase
MTFSRPASRVPHPAPLIIAAPASGCGKTTVTLGLLAALRRRGLSVAPFKVGPDFIDPGHHAVVCGSPSRNLDGWMCGETFVREAFDRGRAEADLAVIEGVMGLFDGAAGDSDEGSTAEIAGWLGGRILLVVDARSQARSAAALLKGFCTFNPKLEFAGVLFNRVGSDRHEQLLREAVASVPVLPPVLGCLRREEELTLPDRHLGLVTAAETAMDEAFIARLADWMERHVDIERLLTGRRGQVLTFDKEALVKCQDLTPKVRMTPKVRIAVARDEAFCFCYPENLELLEAAGAEIVPFSPLADATLPERIDGVYLPGGYPELHAGSLARNGSLLRDLREAADAGVPVYAECGGFMLLAGAIDDMAMAGIFPGRARMLKKRKALGYREVTFTADTPLGPKGTTARGHEFHYSEMDLPDTVDTCYRLSRRGGEQLGAEGYRTGNVLGSYIHLHFGSNPQLATNFVAFCRKRSLL